MDVAAHFQFQWSKDPLLPTLVFIIHKFCTLMESLICNLNLRNSFIDLMIFNTKKLHFQCIWAPKGCLKLASSSFILLFQGLRIAGLLLWALDHIKGIFRWNRHHWMWSFISFISYNLTFVSYLWAQDQTIQLEHPNDQIWYDVEWWLWKKKFSN